MAKAGMKRPDSNKTHTPINSVAPVPEIQGKAKHGKEKARPIIENGERTPHKVFHQLKGDGSVGDAKAPF